LKKKSLKDSLLSLIEKRKHPRFFLSGEQFKETKTRRIFSVYDLSLIGFSLKVEEEFWPVGSVMSGVLNLHPESIEVSGRLISYYGQRAAFKFELMSTYARSSLARSLSAQRLGKSLQFVKEKLSIADYWYHGACNTDILVRTNQLPKNPSVLKVDIFYSNYYCGWDSSQEKLVTGICQSIGKEKFTAIDISQEPVTMESLQVTHDKKPDQQKVDFAKAILDAANIEPAIKRQIADKFKF